MSIMLANFGKYAISDCPFMIFVMYTERNPHYLILVNADYKVEGGVLPVNNTEGFPFKEWALESKYMYWQNIFMILASIKCKRQYNSCRFLDGWVNDRLCNFLWGMGGCFGG